MLVFNYADCFIYHNQCVTVTQGQGVISFLQVSIAGVAPDPWLKVIQLTIRVYKTPLDILDQSSSVHSLHPDVCPTGLEQLLRDREHLWREIPLREKSSVPPPPSSILTSSDLAKLRGLQVSTVKNFWFPAWRPLMCNFESFSNKRQASFETCFWARLGMDYFNLVKIGIKLQDQRCKELF